MTGCRNPPRRQPTRATPAPPASPNTTLSHSGLQPHAPSWTPQCPLCPPGGPRSRPAGSAQTARPAPAWAPARCQSSPPGPPAGCGGAVGHVWDQRRQVSVPGACTGSWCGGRHLAARAVHAGQGMMAAAASTPPPHLPLRRVLGVGVADGALHHLNGRHQRVHACGTRRGHVCEARLARRLPPIRCRCDAAHLLQACANVAIISWSSTVCRSPALLAMFAPLYACLHHPTNRVTPLHPPPHRVP